MQKCSGVCQSLFARHAFIPRGFQFLQKKVQQKLLQLPTMHEISRITLASWTNAHGPQQKLIRKSIKHVPSMPFCSRIFPLTLVLHQMLS